MHVRVVLDLEVVAVTLVQGPKMADPCQAHPHLLQPPAQASGRGCAELSPAARRPQGLPQQPCGVPRSSTSPSTQSKYSPAPRKPCTTNRPRSKVPVCTYCKQPDLQQPCATQLLSHNCGKQRVSPYSSEEFIAEKRCAHPPTHLPKEKPAIRPFWLAATPSPP